MTFDTTDMTARTVPPPAGEQPDYGVDAPDIIRNFLLAGLVLLGGAGVLSLRIRGRSRSRISAFAPPLIGAAGIVPLGLGLSMIAYARRGKFHARDRILDRVAWRGDERVLDIGTGRGLLAIGAAKRLTTGNVVGIDIWNAADLSDNGIEGARRNARIEGVEERVEIRDGDARDLSFAPDESFDVIVSLLCLHNIEEAAGREAACRAIAKGLKPGGVALIADYVGTSDYARWLAQAGLTVTERVSLVRDSYGLMWVVEAQKPT